MTQEDKDLLLKDLCARLPYGVMINNTEWDVNYTLNPINLQWIENYIDCHKPYLRPMSSMTEEEEEQFQNVNVYECPYMVEGIDWLNAHHFDYRGLIEKGLAISTEEFDPYKD